MKINRLKTSVCLGALSSVFALTLALTLGSCTKDPLGQGEQPNSEYMDLTLELTPPGEFTAASKAMTDEKQNAIGSAYVLVFKNDKLFDHKPGVTSNANGATTTIKVTLKTSQSPSELFDIMVIGNPPKDFIFKDNITKDELKATLTAAATAKWVDAPFAMYGEVLQTQIKATNNFFNIQMLRSLARIDIGVGSYNDDGTWDGLEGWFELSEVRVYNTSNKFAVIPTATTLNASGKVKVDAPTIPKGNDINADPWIYPSDDIVEGKYIQSTIFLAEALKDKTKGVTLVVGGKFLNGTITYYRIDMCVPDGMRYRYLDILRNHLYRITIIDVSDEGFITPEEALTSDPINITTILTPIEEGGSGDIIFDSNNSMLTDASSVQIYGEPDGVKSYDMFKVKATFEEGTSAAISGPDFSVTKLVNGVTEKISYVIPKGTTSGSYTIKVGRLSKVIPFTVQSPVDAHFDFLPFRNVASITVVTPQKWLTLSQNSTYVAKEQQSSQVLGDSNNNAYLHFDENIVHEDEPPRTARALVHRKIQNAGTTGVILEQLNLSGMVVGKFGGAMGTLGYPHKLAVEAVEEFRERFYDGRHIVGKRDGLRFNFDGTVTSIINPEYGRPRTIELAQETHNNIISAPYTIYNNYQARYCYDKNRDTNGNGKIDDTEVVWYLPAANQLMSVWVANITNFVKSDKINDYYYGSATEFYTNVINDDGYGGNHAYFFNFKDGFKTYGSRSIAIPVRCVRDLIE